MIFSTFNASALFLGGVVKMKCYFLFFDGATKKSHTAVAGRVIFRFYSLFVMGANL